MTPQIRTGLARAIAERGGAALRQALVEGMQEGVQGVLQDLIARGYDPKQIIGSDLFRDTTVGGIVGGVLGVVLGGRRPTVQPPPPAAQPPTGQPPPGPQTQPPATEQPPPPTAELTREEIAALMPPPPGTEPPAPSELRRMVDTPPDAPLIERVEVPRPRRQPRGSLVIRLSIDTIAVGRARR
jgi:hypothetical protein